MKDNNIIYTVEHLDHKGEFSISAINGMPICSHNIDTVLRGFEILKSSLPEITMQNITIRKYQIVEMQ